MKTFRILGAVLSVFGFIFALLGILASVFPLIENEQIKLILNSFQEASTDTLTNTLNAIVLFCLHQNYFLIFCGICLMVAGGLIGSSVHKLLNAVQGEAEPQTADMPFGTDTPGVPKPAYYPGGLEPPAIALPFDQQEDEAPVPGSAFPVKQKPILGSIEAAYSSDENDAEKLMRNDQQLIEQPPKPDYPQYVSNTTPDEPSESTNETPFPEPPEKPRIVSTMRKRKR